MWLEMARDDAHGGPGWEFATCLWSPTERRGGGKWGYWELMRQVREGDSIIHLRGRENPTFVGVSTADSDCYETAERPTNPGAWSHADRFYRVPLRDYTPFATPVALKEVFAARREALIAYRNRKSPASKPGGKLLFYVQQANRLQCQNGAYLSEFEAELAEIVTGSGRTKSDRRIVSDAPTGSMESIVKIRIGHEQFASRTKDNYQGQCAFPGCEVNERAFLVGSHIARWSDCTKLRGDLSNGLCLCVFHDRAFELGYYSLDERHCIELSPKHAESSVAVSKLRPYQGARLKPCTVLPSLEAINHHRSRVGMGVLGATGSRP